MGLGRIRVYLNQNHQFRQPKVLRLPLSSAIPLMFYSMVILTVCLTMEPMPFPLHWRLCVKFPLNIFHMGTPSTSTLEGLLGCNSSDVLDKINLAGVREAVTITELSKKLVYLCIEEKICPTLVKVHEQCKLKKLSFEMVLAYLPFLDCLDPKVYKVKIDSWLQNHNISWWHLPFNNSISRRLRRLSICPSTTRFIISSSSWDPVVN
ncbi:hypothetical protein OROHE_017460 [Orobanche hederae]